MTERINLIDRTPETTFVYRPQEGMVSRSLSVDLTPDKLPIGMQLESFQTAAQFRVSGGTFIHYGLDEQAEKGLLAEYKIQTLPSLVSPDITEELGRSYRITLDRRVEIVRLANRGNGWVVEFDNGYPTSTKERVLPVVYLKHRKFSQYKTPLSFEEETPEYSSTFPVLEYLEITDSLPFFDPSSGLFRLP